MIVVVPAIPWVFPFFVLPLVLRDCSSILATRRCFLPVFSRLFLVCAEWITKLGYQLFISLLSYLPPAFRRMLEGNVFIGVCPPSGGGGRGTPAFGARSFGGGVPQPASGQVPLRSYPSFWSQVPFGCMGVPQPLVPGPFWGVVPSLWSHVHFGGGERAALNST